MSWLDFGGQKSKVKVAAGHRRNPHRCWVFEIYFLVRMDIFIDTFTFGDQNSGTVHCSWHGRDGVKDTTDIQFISS